MAEEMVRISDYPQLQLIMWSTPHLEEVDGQTAFATYERNWRHVDVDAITDVEKAFISHLTIKYGNGVMSV